MFRRRRTSANASAFTARYGPWAVVAGASEGLGAAFARALAERGLNLLLVARRQPLLEEVAGPLRRKVEVRTASLDLAAADLEGSLRALCRDLEVGLLVYNAAYSPRGPFLDQALADKERSLAVNCRGPLVAAHVLGPAMAARGRGGIVLMSSLTAFWGSPWLATYGATKAFNLSLGEALWGELRGRGVDVLSCCAGATATPGFLEASAAAGSRAPRSMSPKAVVDEALAALGRRPSMIPGIANRLAARALNLMPRRRAIAIMGAETAKLHDA